MKNRNNTAKKPRKPDAFGAFFFYKITEMIIGLRLVLA